MAKSICLVATLELVALFLALTIFASSGAFIIPGTPEQISIGDEHHQTSESAVSAGNNKIAKDLEHSLGIPLTTMSFAGTSGINVYRMQGRKNYHSKYLYQFSPAAILDSSTITQWYSGVNSQHYFGFRVQMWNETIQQAVASHLTRVTGRKVRTYQVQSMPFDRVILTRTGDEVEDERFQIAQPWVPYTQTVGFGLACFDKSECQQLVEQFKNEPEKFDKFKLAYSIDSRRQTENRAIQVTQSMLTQTNQLFSQISKRFTKTSEILLTVSDAQRLLWHAVSDICRENFRDQPEAIVPRELHKIIYDHLEKATVAAKLTISTADDAKWSTVYWEDPLSRPDAIARSLNERKRHLLRHDVEMDDDFDVREDELHDNQQVSGSSRDWKMRAKEAIDALYEQNKDLVTFNGDKFVPKPIQLYKIKLNAIRENRIWKDLGRIEVSYHPEVDMTGPIIHSSLGLILPPSGIQSYSFILLASILCYNYFVVNRIGRRD